MSINKATVQTYIDGFNASDHEKILSCLTEDIQWEMPGQFNLSGKEEFDKEIENPNFTGKPVIHIVRMIEEDDIVVAEGTVQAKFKDGGILHAEFCDVFHMRDGKIRMLKTYLMNK